MCVPTGVSVTQSAFVYIYNVHNITLSSVCLRENDTPIERATDEAISLESRGEDESRGAHASARQRGLKIIIITTATQHNVTGQL